MRSAGSAYEERYLGTRVDALIAGSNIELSNRLTPIRRPGNSVYNSQTFDAVDLFYSFRLFNTNLEEIKVIVDTATALYDGTGPSTKDLIFTKSAGAGETTPLGVGNTLFFGNGVDQKKWVQSLIVWTASTHYPVDDLATFLIDSNGNLQQLINTIVPIAHVNVTSNVLTITRSGTTDLTTVLSADLQVTFENVAVSTFLNGQTVTILSVTSSTFTAAFTHADVDTADTGTGVVVAGGSPETGTVQPTWNVTLFGTTDDNTARWINRGDPIENWGIVGPSTVPDIVVNGASGSSWNPDTFYSNPQSIIDSNGNLQTVTTAGKSSSSTPTWSTTVGGTTTDGTVTWTMVQTAASLVWQASKQYLPSSITSYSITANVVTVIQNNNFFVGQTIIPSGLSTGTYLNNQYLKIASRNATQWTAAFTHANVGATPDSGIGTPSPYLVNNASGQNCLFKIASASSITLNGSVAIKVWAVAAGPQGGQFIETFPAPAPDSTSSVNSLYFNTNNTATDPLANDVEDGSGALTGATVSLGAFASSHFNLAASANITVPVAGQYSISIKHQNGFIWGIGTSGGNNPVQVSGINSNPVGQTHTAVNNYPLMGSNNNRGSNGPAGTVTDTFVINFPVAGVYPIEIDFSVDQGSFKTLFALSGGSSIAPEPSQSGTVQPIWPAWTTAFAPAYPSITESQNQYKWNNIGPIADFVWSANTNFNTTATINIIDPLNNLENPYEAGVSGTNQPTFATGLNQLTNDNPNLIWINQGPATAPPPGTISTFNGGWQYVIALVNTMTDTVSNAGPATASTGNFIGADNVTISGGLPTDIDPQVDYVAIFRTKDGGSTFFLIPGTGNSVYTTTLADYQAGGYVDTTLDSGLNIELQAAVNGENTPPAVGAVNLAYHLSRIFFSVGNTVYWTSGPDAPVGNGIEGVDPINVAVFPSLVKKIVPTGIGALIFTVSDIYNISGNGTDQSPLFPVPFLPGKGISSYNALTINGTTIYLFSTSNTVMTLDPSSGYTDYGFAIGDQFANTNNWTSSDVYLTWHESGEDVALFVADGSTGWFRNNPTPAPETGITWSPFATIQGGVKAIQSIETSPGTHMLLLGPTVSGPILARDLSLNSDNGSSYTAGGTIGSIVLAQPGQIAEVAFITTEAKAVGSRPTLAVLLDEISGVFDPLTNWEDDPPLLEPSKSIYSQRFYLLSGDNPAICRHMQIQWAWPAEDQPNELYSMTIYGGYLSGM